MAYTLYYPNDLDRLDGQLAAAVELSKKLRTEMMSRTPQLLNLNSFATAELNLRWVIDNLENCKNQIKAGDKRLAAKAKGKRINKISEQRAAKKTPGKRSSK